jgi:hypothetical protein
MDMYIHWVLKDRLGLTEREIKNNKSIIYELAEIEFIWRHPMDENRALEGLELRSDFEYETGEYLDKSSGIMAQCTMFEMLAALAIRCENQIMRNSLIGDRTSKWFFEFLDNLSRDTSHISLKYVFSTYEYDDSDKEVKYYTIKKSKGNIGSSNGKYLMIYFYCEGDVEIENVEKIEKKLDMPQYYLLY